MHYKQSWGSRLYEAFAYIFVGLFSIACVYPMLHMLAISVSDKNAVNANLVNLIPVGFNLDAYQYILTSGKFMNAFWISVKRVFLGVSVTMFLTVLTGCPLAMSDRHFSARTKYMWFFVFTMLFGGGLIPSYILVYNLGLRDSLWALILPGVAAGDLILYQNYVKSLPEELSEAARIDGAGEVTLIYKIILPLSKPMLATLTLFSAVGHWNSWFDGMIYMSREYRYPLQTYLRTVVVQSDVDLAMSVGMAANVTPENTKAAQIILALIPILMVYPFLQKHFTKGIVLGSVKG